MSETIRPDTEEPVIEDEKLRSDLERYRQMAIDLGADDARIVRASDIVQRIRARLAETFPRGQSMQTSYFRNIVDDMPWKYVKAMLASYRYAIFGITRFRGDVPNVFTGPSSGPGQLNMLVKVYGKYWPPEEAEYWKSVFEKRGGFATHNRGAISKRIMDAARRDGYQYAFCGQSGSCLGLCIDAGFDSCVALKTGICRMPGRTGPAGTAQIMGVDAPATYAKFGWQSWVAGWSVFPEDYPNGPISPDPTSTMTIFIA